MTAMHADKTCVVYEDERLTYAEVDARVRSLARYLRETCGVDRGDRVAIAMRNYPEWVIAYWATVTIGATVVGMNGCDRAGNRTSEPHVSRVSSRGPHRAHP